MNPIFEIETATGGVLFSFPITSQITPFSRECFCTPKTTVLPEAGEKIDCKR